MTNRTSDTLSGNKPKTRSLQSQYIFVAVLLGFLLVISSSIGYLNIVSSAKEISQQADTASRILNLSSNIGKQSNLAYTTIQAFMLDPDLDSHRAQLEQEIDIALYNTNELIREKLVKTLSLSELLNKISTNLMTLKSHTDHLFKIRIDVSKQYPALDISIREMNPLSDEIMTALRLTLLEYQENPQRLLNTLEYSLLNEAMINWMSTISEYRMYLVNRMGSIRSDSTAATLNSVHIKIDQMKKIVAKLNDLNLQNKFDFQGSNLIEQLPMLLDTWEKQFEKIKKVNHSIEWRQDNMLLEQKIKPLISGINIELKIFDDRIKLKYQKIIEDKTTASTQQNYILVSIIIIFLAYIIISIKLLQRLIIKPIAAISSTMKNEAYHHNGFHFPEITRTQETQDLIDAFNEMSHQVFKRQDELEFQAMHDSLTSLPNRLMLHQRLDYHLIIAARERQNLIFMMLDLNRFKEINDTLGHHIGDNLLVQVGTRISQTLREVDTVARLGGDEFAVLLPNTNNKQAIIVANSISRILEKPFIVNDYELQISASIGIAEFPSDGATSHTLMQHADVAMYISKREMSGHHFYSATEDSHSVGRLSLSSDLKSAIENGQLELHYQPKYNIKTGSIIGAEALLRWKHPESGFIPPENIISLAEEMGLINDLSNWIIENAIEFCGTHSKAHPDCTISINLSAHNLKDQHLPGNISRWLELHEVKSQNLCFEITESAMMTNPEKSIQVLNRLHALGIKLSIDDFGTGFSSLAYLKLLPVTELKIDKSFVMDILHDESDRLIVHSTIELSHNLGLNVVAEGIENADCWNMLHDMGCDCGQGYFMSKPLNKEDFSALLNARKTGNKANASSL